MSPAVCQLRGKDCHCLPRTTGTICRTNTANWRIFIAARSLLTAQSLVVAAALFTWMRASPASLLSLSSFSLLNLVTSAALLRKKSYVNNFLLCLLFLFMKGKLCGHYQLILKVVPSFNCFARFASFEKTGPTEGEVHSLFADVRKGPVWVSEASGRSNQYLLSWLSFCRPTK